MAGFSNSELTVSRPGEKAVLAQDGWQYSLGRIKLPVLSTGLLATLPEKNSGKLLDLTFPHTHRSRKNEMTKVNKFLI